MLILNPPRTERNKTICIDVVGLMTLDGHIKLFTAYHLASKSPKLDEEQSQASEHKTKRKENLYLVSAVSVTLMRDT